MSSLVWSRRALALSLSTLGALALIPSCSDEAGIPTPYLSEESFYQQLSATVCERRAQCACLSKEEETSCQSTTTASLRARFQPPGATRTYDGSCAYLLLDELGHRAGCEPSFESLVQTTRCTLGCAVFSGTTPAGGSCTPGNGDSQCAAPLSCSYQGTCVDACPATAGMACGSSTPDYRSCQEQSSQCRCSPDGTSCTCVPRAQLGEACGNLGCAQGLECGCTDGSCQSAVCKAIPRVGEPCPQGSCEPGSFCTPAPTQPPPEGFVRMCKALLPEGAGCNSFAQCRSSFCPDGVCREAPEVGQPCYQETCGPRDTCREGTCTASYGPLCSFP